jgi:16S rRNA (uracil1498-N3)-methyltransferase
MPRFFVNKDKIADNVIEIEGPDAFHIARSLRMAVGDEITVCDGEGAEYSATLTKIRDEICISEIRETKKSEAELPVSVTLYMAYPKGDKLETVIQKAVELGCDRIVPFESSRCIKRPKAEKNDKLLSRFGRIAEEAAKQCGRSKLPTVSAPASFKEMLAKASEEDLILFCYEDEKQLSVRSAL